MHEDSMQKKFLANLIAEVRNTKRTQEQDDQAIARIRKWFQTDPNKQVQKEAILHYMTQRSIDYKKFKEQGKIPEQTR